MMTDGAPPILSDDVVYLAMTQLMSDTLQHPQKTGLAEPPRGLVRP